MHNPVNWTYLTAPADQTAVWGPFSITFLLLFGVGLVGTIALRNGIGLGRCNRRTYDIVHRGATILMPILALGLVFFLLRYLRVSAFSLSMRLWLYLTLLAAVAVVGYFAYAAYAARSASRRADNRSTAPVEKGEATTNRSYARLAVALFVVYMAIAIGLYVWRGVYIHPDRLAVPLFITALLLGRWKAFLRDWIPVVFLLFGYEFMRGLAYEFVGGQHRAIHLAELVAADRAMFGGHIPAIWLQHKLFVQGTIHWYDIMAVVLYAMHFVLPLLFAFLLWMESRDRFWHFTLAFLLMSYTGFVIYLIYPAAPPWLASDWGVVPKVQLPFNQVWHLLIPHPLNNFDTIQLWNGVSGNPVAAMPSLHAAFPWITMLFAFKYFGKKGLIFVPYNLALWFSVLYLGQHWFVDVLAGVLLASLSFVVMELAWPRVQQLANRPLRAPRPAWSGNAVERMRLTIGRQRRDHT